MYQKYLLHYLEGTEFTVRESRMVRGTLRYRKFWKRSLSSAKGYINMYIGPYIMAFHQELADGDMLRTMITRF